MSRAPSSQRIDSLSPPRSSQVLNAASSSGPRQRVMSTSPGRPQIGEGASSTCGGLNSQGEQPIDYAGPEVLEQSPSPERRVDAVLAPSTPRARASGNVRSRRHIVLPLDEKVRLATIAWEHRVAYLNSPISGKFPDVLAWELIMNDFHEVVRSDVFTSPIETKTTLNNICRTRREKSNGPFPPVRSGYSDELQGAIDLWNTVWKLRNLRLDLYKFYGSLADVIARPQLQRLCGVDPSIPILDAESMAPFLLCKPVCEELQRRDMNLRKNRRRTRGMSLYPFDSSSESDHAYTSDDDVVRPDDPNPMPTIEEEHAADVESLPSSAVSRQMQDRLAHLEKLFVEQYVPVDKKKDNFHPETSILSARESVPFDRPLKFTQERPHKSPVVERELRTTKYSREKSLTQTDLPTSPVSPPRLLSDIMGPFVGPGVAALSQTRPSLGSTEDILPTNDDSNILASLPSNLTTAATPSPSSNPASSAEKDWATTCGVDNIHSRIHIAPNETISDSLLRIRDNHHSCSDNQHITQSSSSPALGSEINGLAGALPYDREKPGTKPKKKARKRVVREGTAPELRRENEEHARRREQRRVAPLFPAIKPRVVKTIPQSTSCPFENQKQSHILSSRPADLPTPEPPRFKMPSPLPAWVRTGECGLDTAMPDQSQGANRDLLEHHDDDDDDSNSTTRRKKHSRSVGHEIPPADNLCSITSDNSSQPPTHVGRGTDQDPSPPLHKPKQQNIPEEPKLKRRRDKPTSDTTESHAGDGILSLDVEENSESAQRRSILSVGKRERSKKKRSRQRLERAPDAEDKNADAEWLNPPDQPSRNMISSKRKRVEPIATHSSDSRKAPKRQKITSTPRSQKLRALEANKPGPVRGRDKRHRGHRHHKGGAPRIHEREMTTESQAAMVDKTSYAQISMLSNKYKEVKTDIGKQNEEMVQLRQELEKLHRLLQVRDGNYN